MSIDIRKLAARYGRKIDIIEIAEEIINEQYHINAFNYPPYPVITADDEIQAYHWGLIPHWVKSPEDARKIRQMTLNARSETLFSKPSYRDSIRKRRCLIPATGFLNGDMKTGKRRLIIFI